MGFRPDVGCGPRAVGPDALSVGFSELTCVVSSQTRRDSVPCLLSTWRSETPELLDTSAGRVPTTRLYPQPSPGSPPPTRLQSLPQEASRKSCQKALLPGRGGPSQVPVCLKQSHRRFKGTYQTRMERLVFFLHRRRSRQKSVLSQAPLNSQKPLYSS